MRYTAVVESRYIRGAQIYRGDPARIDESANECVEGKVIGDSHVCGVNTFIDLKYPRHYIGDFDGMAEDEILHRAAYTQGVHPNTISLIPIDTMDDEIFGSDIVEHILRLCRWVWRKRLRDKNYMFTRDNLKIDREVEFCDGEACAYIEVWFDVEKKFGLKLRGDEYINAYAYISRDDVRVTYEINYADSFIDKERTFKSLTQAEKIIIREMVNEISLQELKMTLDEALEECDG